MVVNLYSSVMSWSAFALRMMQKIIRMLIDFLASIISRNLKQRIRGELYCWMRRFAVEDNANEEKVRKFRYGDVVEVNGEWRVALSVPAKLLEKYRYTLSDEEMSDFEQYTQLVELATRLRNPT